MAVTSSAPTGMWRCRHGLLAYHVGRSTFTDRPLLELATELAVVCVHQTFVIISHQGWRLYYNNLTGRTMRGPLPKLPLRSVDGQPYNSASLQGKVLMLNFFASW